MKSLQSEIQVNPIIINPPPRNFFFINRPAYQDKLREKLNEHNLVVLVGVSGYGKTQLAHDYFYQQIKQKNYDIFLWLSVDDNVEKSIQQCIEECKKLDSLNLDSDQKPTLQTLCSALQKSSKKWLLVLDNLKKEEDAEIFASCSGHVIITANIGYYYLFPIIKLTPFTREESIEYLKKRVLAEQKFYPELNDQAKKIADDVGDYPLLLEKVATYIIKDRMGELSDIDFHQLKKTFNENLMINSKDISDLFSQEPSLIVASILIHFALDEIPYSSLKTIHEKLLSAKSSGESKDKDLSSLDETIKYLSKRHLITRSPTGIKINHRQFQKELTQEFEKQKDPKITLEQILSAVQSIFELSRTRAEKPSEEIIDLVPHIYHLLKLAKEKDLRTDAIIRLRASLGTYYLLFDKIIKAQRYFNIANNYFKHVHGDLVKVIEKVIPHWDTQLLSEKQISFIKKDQELLKKLEDAKFYAVEILYNLGRTNLKDSSYIDKDEAQRKKMTVGNLIQSTNLQNLLMVKEDFNDRKNYYYTLFNLALAQRKFPDSHSSAIDLLLKITEEQKSFLSELEKERKKSKEGESDTLLSKIHETKQQLVVFFGQLGVSYCEDKNYAKAEENGIDCLMKFEELSEDKYTDGNYKKDKAVCLRNLAVTYLKSADNEKVDEIKKNTRIKIADEKLHLALRLHQQHFGIEVLVSNKPYIIELLAEANWKLGYLHIAKEFIDTALALKIKLYKDDKHRFVKDALHLKEEIEKAINNPIPSRKNKKTLKEINEKRLNLEDELQKPIVKWETYLEYAHNCYKLQKMGEAEFIYKLWLNCINSHMTSKGSTMPWEIALVYYRLGRIYSITKEFTKALSYFEITKKYCLEQLSFSEQLFQATSEKAIENNEVSDKSIEVKDPTEKKEPLINEKNQNYRKKLNASLKQELSIQKQINWFNRFALFSKNATPSIRMINAWIMKFEKYLLIYSGEDKRLDKTELGTGIGKGIVKFVIPKVKITNPVEVEPQIGEAIESFIDIGAQQHKANKDYKAMIILERLKVKNLDDAKQLAKNITDQFMDIYGEQINLLDEISIEKFSVYLVHMILDFVASSNMPLISLEPVDILLESVLYLTDKSFISQKPKLYTKQKQEWDPLELMQLSGIETPTKRFFVARPIEFDKHHKYKYRKLSAVPREFENKYQEFTSKDQADQELEKYTQKSNQKSLFRKKK